MKRFALSALSVLLAAGALAPMSQAAEAKAEKSFNIHQLRTVEFDSRDKSFDFKDGYSIHQQRLAELDNRGKASLTKVSLTEQRYQVLDRGGDR